MQSLSQRILNEVNSGLALIELTDRNMDDLSVADNCRHRIALSCLQLTLEHANSSFLLIQHGFIGTAAALIRVIFESYVRGMWVLHAASDAEINKFLEDKTPKTSDLLLRLEKIPDLYGEFF